MTRPVSSGKKPGWAKKLREAPVKGGALEPDDVDDKIGWKPDWLASMQQRPRSTGIKNAKSVLVRWGNFTRAQKSWWGTTRVCPLEQSTAAVVW